MSILSKLSVHNSIKIRIVQISGLESILSSNEYTEIQLKLLNVTKIFSIDELDQLNFVKHISGGTFNFNFKIHLSARKNKDDKFHYIGYISSTQFSDDQIKGGVNSLEINFFIENDQTNNSVICQIIVSHVEYEPIKEFTKSEFQFDLEDAAKPPQKIFETDTFTLYYVYSQKSNKKYLLKEFKLDEIRTRTTSNDQLLLVDDIPKIECTQNFPTLLPVVGFIRETTTQSTEPSESPEKSAQPSSTIDDQISEQKVDIEDKNLSDDDDKADTTLVSCILYHYLRHVTLHDLIHTETNIKKYNNDYKTITMYELSHALTSLHSYGIAHGHLNPWNVLVDTKTLESKLYDYELSKDIVGKDLGGIYYGQPAEYEYTVKTAQTAADKKLIFGEDIRCLALIFFEIATGMMKNNLGDEDLIYLSSNLRLVFRAMMSKSVAERPLAEELLYLIKSTNFGVFDTHFKHVKRRASRFDSFDMLEGLHSSTNAELRQLVKVPNRTSFETSVVCALQWLHKESNESEQLFEAMKNELQNPFLLALLGRSYADGYNGFKPDEGLSEFFTNSAFTMAQMPDNKPDYHFCMINFDETVDEFSIWWQFQQIRTGMRDSSIYFKNFRRLKMDPKYDGHLEKIVEVLRKESEENPNVSVSLAMLLQLDNPSSDEIDRLLQLGVKDYVTRSLSPQLATSTEDYLSKKKVGAVHNSKEIIAELAYYYYYYFYKCEKKCFFECERYAKSGAVNKHPQCEYIRGMLLKEQGENEKANSYFERAEKHKKRPIVKRENHSSDETSTNDDDEYDFEFENVDFEKTLGNPELVSKFEFHSDDEQAEAASPKSGSEAANSRFFYKSDDNESDKESEEDAKLRVIGAESAVLYEKREVKMKEKNSQQQEEEEEEEKNEEKEKSKQQEEEEKEVKEKSKHEEEEKEEEESDDAVDLNENSETEESAGEQTEKSEEESVDVTDVSEQMEESTREQAEESDDETSSLSDKSEQEKGGAEEQEEKPEDKKEEDNETSELAAQEEKPEVQAEDNEVAEVAEQEESNAVELTEPAEEEEKIEGQAEDNEVVEEAGQEEKLEKQDEAENEVPEEAEQEASHEAEGEENLDSENGEEAPEAVEREVALDEHGELDSQAETEAGRDADSDAKQEAQQAGEEAEPAAKEEEAETSDKDLSADGQSSSLDENNERQEEAAEPAEDKFEQQEAGADQADQEDARLDEHIKKLQERIEADPAQCMFADDAADNQVKRAETVVSVETVQTAESIEVMETAKLDYNEETDAQSVKVSSTLNVAARAVNVQVETTEKKVARVGDIIELQTSRTVESVRKLEYVETIETKKTRLAVEGGKDGGEQEEQAVSHEVAEGEAEEEEKNKDEDEQGESLEAAEEGDEVSEEEKHEDAAGKSEPSEQAEPLEAAERAVQLEGEREGAGEPSEQAESLETTELENEQSAGSADDLESEKQVEEQDAQHHIQEEAEDAARAVESPQQDGERHAFGFADREADTEEEVVGQHEAGSDEAGSLVDSEESEPSGRLEREEPAENEEPISQSDALERTSELEGEEKEKKEEALEAGLSEQAETLEITERTVELEEEKMSKDEEEENEHLESHEATEGGAEVEEEQHEDAAGKSEASEQAEPHEAAERAVELEDEHEDAADASENDEQPEGGAEFEEGIQIEEPDDKYSKSEPSEQSAGSADDLESEKQVEEQDAQHHIQEEAEDAARAVESPQQDGERHAFGFADREADTEEEVVGQHEAGSDEADSLVDSEESEPSGGLEREEPAENEEPSSQSDALERTSELEGEEKEKEALESGLSEQAETLEVTERTVELEDEQAESLEVTEREIHLEGDDRLEDASDKSESGPSSGNTKLLDESEKCRSNDQSAVPESTLAKEGEVAQSAIVEDQPNSSRESLTTLKSEVNNAENEPEAPNQEVQNGIINNNEESPEDGTQFNESTEPKPAIRSTSSVVIPPATTLSDATASSLIAARDVSGLVTYLASSDKDELKSAVLDEAHRAEVAYYSAVVRELAALDDPAALHKLAVSLIFASNGREERLPTRDQRTARTLLDRCIKRGYLLSYFSQARLLHEVFCEDNAAFELAREGCAKGDKHSMCLLGRFIFHGIGIKCSRARGVALMLSSGCFDYYKRFATDIGLYYACINDRSKAFDWFELAYTLRRTRATTNNIGVCYMAGYGVAKDLAKAAEIFKDGVNRRGDENSMYHLAYLMLSKGDRQGSLKMYHNSADKSHSLAQIEYSALLKDEGQIDQSKVYFNLAANSGHPGSLAAIGFLAEDPDESFAAFKQAADAGNVDAIVALAKKASIDGDTESAYKYMRLCARMGRSQVPLEYGVSLYNARHYERARDFLVMAADVNNPAAKFFIAVMTFYGQGVEVDKKKAYTQMKYLADRKIERAIEFIEENFKKSEIESFQ